MWTKVLCFIIRSSVILYSMLNYLTAMLICLRGFIDKDHYVMVFRMFTGQ